MDNQYEFAIKLATDAWHAQVNRASKLFDNLTDEQLQKQVAPNRNTGTYLLGHLAAVHDAMFPLMGFGSKLHPELEEIFIKNPDSSGLTKPAIAQLRTYWKEVNSSLNDKLDSLQPHEWLDRHTAVSEEDFAKEPHRNKLNLLLGRTSHISYHLGQLAFL